MKPSLDFLRITNKGGGSSPARIEIRGPIDMKWDSENYSITDTEKEVLKLLKTIPEDTETHVHVSSEGGSVKMALGIHNAFKPRAGKLTFHNAGVMFSSATILAPKGSKVIAPRASLYGIHNPSFETSGPMNAEDCQQAAESLKAVGEMIAGIYADRTGKSIETCKGMMKRTTLMAGQKAVDEGFADETGDEEPDEDDVVKNALAANVTMLFSDLPKEFRARIEARATGGNPPSPTPPPQKQSMKKLLAALVEAKLIASADIDEDQAVHQVQAALGRINGETTRMKTENEGHVAALKLRVTNRVKAAIEGKKVKPEREASLLAMGIANEANLDFLDDISASGAAPAAPAAAPRRGAPAAPPVAPAENDTETKINAILDDINALRCKKDLRPEAVASQIGTLTAKLKTLRGDKPAEVVYSQVH